MAVLELICNLRLESLLETVLKVHSPLGLFIDNGYHADRKKTCTHVSMSSAPATCNYILQYNLIVCKNWHPSTHQMSTTFSKLSTVLLHLLLYQYIVTILSTEWLNTDMV